ncbi:MULTISPECIES: potassium channel family protein [Streptomyces]|uniref:potassium channel family protein n=1 Tax=Streptomyces TaxID=1883 RepID=UPI000F71D184|nr:potassium channel family protein [Streptomyces sp. W1SF4]AZM89826.1 two pore domain potassium channel family protein [Streptomyces sp. W1SF4]
MGGGSGWMVVLVHLLRAVGSGALVTYLYYVAPLDYGFGVVAVAALAAGLLVFGCLIVWQVKAIARSAHPRLRVLEALGTAVPLFLMLFSAAYFLLSGDRPGSFSEALSRTDALYFTVTVFATVGFGDIVPADGTGRALVTAQMVADLIMVGLVAKVLFGAVETGLSRRPEKRSGP